MQKSKRSSNRNTTIILIIALAIIIATLAYYKTNKVHLADKTQYHTFREDLITASENFNSNKDMQKYLSEWASDNHLLYSIDEHGNIIIAKNANAENNTLPATVVCADYNYRTVTKDSDAIVSAQTVAASNVDGGPSEVIFLNNEKNLYEGVKAINTAYFPEKSNIIYLDTGSKLFISNASFASELSDVTIPYSTSRLLIKKSHGIIGPCDGSGLHPRLCNP